MSTLRYAGYIRVSTEGQAQGYSLDSQKNAIKQLVNVRGGKYARTYTDKGFSGLNLERPAFMQMLCDARRGRFDAIVVHAWDRFGRDPVNNLVVKTLLRKVYGILIFSVRDQSIDEANDELAGIMMEAVGDLSGEWYSKNVGRDISKSLVEKHARGFHNGQSPYGYRKEGAELVPDLEEAPIVNLIFNLYATEQFSHRRIALELRERGYKRRGRDFSIAAIREILVNRVYVGYVSYNAVRYSRGRKQKNSAAVEWGKGRHQPLVSHDIFLKCAQLALSHKHGHPRPKHRTHLLQGLLYCQRCVDNPPENLPRSWGKLYLHLHNKKGITYCQCASKARGYPDCGQSHVETKPIEEQVVDLIKRLKLQTELCLRLGQKASELVTRRAITRQIDQMFELVKQVETAQLRTDLDKYIAHWKMLMDHFVNPRVELDFQQQDVSLATDTLFQFKQ